MWLSAQAYADAFKCAKWAFLFPMICIPLGFCLFAMTGPLMASGVLDVSDGDGAGGFPITAPIGFVLFGCGGFGGMITLTILNNKALNALKLSVRAAALPPSLPARYHLPVAVLAVGNRQCHDITLIFVPTFCVVA